MLSLARGKKDCSTIYELSFQEARIRPPYANLAAELKTTESSVKVTIHRLRRRYRDLLRANVSHTLADPNEVDDEIRFLLNSLSA